MDLPLTLPAVAAAGGDLVEKEVEGLVSAFATAVADAVPSHLRALVGRTGQDGQTTHPLTREIHCERAGQSLPLTTNTIMGIISSISAHQKIIATSVSFDFA